MVVQSKPARPTRNTHAEVQILKCPNCGNELHFSRRTVSVTCRCGKAYMTQQQAPQEKSRF